MAALSSYVMIFQSNINGRDSSFHPTGFSIRLRSFYGTVTNRCVASQSWQLFVKAFAIVFVIFWLHMGRYLEDWLGREGFHLKPSTHIFVPLSFPLPELLWSVTLSGALLMFRANTLAVGSFIAGCGFFYATMSDLTSASALNMNFLFAFAVVFWSTRLNISVAGYMSAWPPYLIQLYLVVVYFGSGWRKVVYGDWLSDHEALLHCVTGFYTTGLTRLLYPHLQLVIWTIMQYLTIFFELGAPLFFLYPPFRKVGLTLGCFLHLGIALLMKDLFYFSFQMLTFYIPFLISIFSLPPASTKSDHQLEI